MDFPFASLREEFHPTQLLGYGHSLDAVCTAALTMELQNKSYFYLFICLLLNMYASQMPLSALSEQSNISMLLTIYTCPACSAKPLTKMMSFARVPTDMGFVASKDRRDSKPNEIPNETLALLTPWHRTQKSLAGVSR